MALAWTELDLTSDPDAIDYSGDPAELFAAVADAIFGDRPLWHELAACKGKTKLFYVDRGQTQDPARALCATCPVRDECLAAALEVTPWNDYGVWGGVSAQARRKMRHGEPEEPFAPDAPTSNTTGCNANDGRRPEPSRRREDRRRADNRPSCVDCGAPCTRTRCLSCHNRAALAAMAPPSAA